VACEVDGAREQKAEAWDTPGLPRLADGSPLLEYNMLLGCAFVRPLSSSAPAKVVASREAARRTFAALASASPALAIDRIKLRAQQFWKERLAMSRPAPVSPSRQQWLQGQLQHLHGASLTPEGDLRRAQIEALVHSGSPRMPSAMIPPAVPSSLRHPWAGFSRQLTVAAIGDPFFDADAMAVLWGRCIGGRSRSRQQARLCSMRHRWRR
jgi:hypothetical protein